MTDDYQTPEELRVIELRWRLGQDLEYRGMYNRQWGAWKPDNLDRSEPSGLLLEIQESWKEMQELIQWRIRPHEHP